MNTAPAYLNDYMVADISLFSFCICFINSRSTIYQAKCKAVRKRLIVWWDDKKSDVFKTAKRMVKTNQDIIGEQCIRKDDSVLAVSNDDRKIA